MRTNCVNAAVIRTIILAKFPGTSTLSNDDLGGIRQKSLRPERN